MGNGTLLIAALGCVLILAFSEADDLTTEQEQKLRKELFNSYDKTVRPAEPNGTLVRVGVSLLSLQGVNEESQTVSATLWIFMQWNDSRLSWKHKTGSYGNFNGSLHIPSTDVWRPDIELYNNAGQSNLLDTQVIVSQNGSVIFVPPVQIQAVCQMDLSFYPHDEHDCFLKFGSWTFDAHLLKLQLRKDSLDMNEYTPHQHWDIEPGIAVRTDRIYECCPEPYTDLTYNFKLIRRVGYRETTTIVSILVPVVFTLSSFVMLADSSRIIVGLLATAVNVYLLNDWRINVPAYRSGTPMIIWFGTWSTVLSTLAVLVSVYLNTRSRNQPQDQPMPKAVKLVYEVFGNKLGDPAPQQKKRKESAGSAENPAGETRLDRVNNTEWSSSLLVLDRLLAIVFLFLYAILFVVSFFQ